MRYSFSLILISLFALISFIGIVLVLIVSFYSYQNSLDRAIKEQSVVLQIISAGVSGPPWATQVPTYPGFSIALIRGALESPGLKFVRVIVPETKTVELSNDTEETGIKFDNLPLFAREVTVRDGVFNGESIKELSMQTKDGRGIWMGFSLADVKKSILSSAIFLGAAMLILFTIIGFLIFFFFRYFFVNPTISLKNSFERLKKGDYEVSLGGAPVVETQEVFQSFNEMVKELGESQTALEESKTVLEIRVMARTRELKELAMGLESRVEERTKELKTKLEELQRFQELTIGRELKMIGLKKEMENLSKKTKKNYDY